jgi:hypothetical protein
MGNHGHFTIDFTSRVNQGFLEEFNADISAAVFAFVNNLSENGLVLVSNGGLLLFSAAVEDLNRFLHLFVTRDVAEFSDLINRFLAEQTQVSVRESTGEQFGAHNHLLKLLVSIFSMIYDVIFLLGLLDFSLDQSEVVRELT